MWDIRDSHSKSAFRKYFEDTVAFVVDPSMWEKYIMHLVKSQLPNVGIRTQNSLLPMYQLLLKRLASNNSNLKSPVRA